MDAYRRHWFNVGLVLFVALSFLMPVWSETLSHVQIVLIYSFMALLVHQYEEYALPGGFPSIFNIAVFGEKNVPERYPLNTNQVLVTNVFLAYPFYIVPIFLPNLIWFGMAQVLFGMLQFIVHGIVINIRLKSLYNPGLASVILLNFPIGIYYLWYVSAQKLVSTSDVALAIVVCIVGAFVMILLPIKLMGSRSSEYAFPDEVFYGYDRQKVEAIRRS
jgi:hypothetical protein